MRCRVGDLAVIIEAHHRGNVGGIVRVVAPHDGTGDLVFQNSGPVWLIEAPNVLTWSVGEKIYRRHIGPAPDSQLQPIRGVSADREIAAAIRKMLQKLKVDAGELARV